MLPVVWIPEANDDLEEARAWYDNIRPQLGERFALAVEATVEAIAEHSLPSRSPGPPLRRSAALPLRNIFRGSRTSNCSNRLLPRQARPQALADALMRARCVTF